MSSSGALRACDSFPSVRRWVGVSDSLAASAVRWAGSSGSSPCPAAAKTPFHPHHAPSAAPQHGRQAQRGRPRRRLCRAVAGLAKLGTCQLPVKGRAMASARRRCAVAASSSTQCCERLRLPEQRACLAVRCCRACSTRAKCCRARAASLEEAQRDPARMELGLDSCCAALGLMAGGNAIGEVCLAASSSLRAISRRSSTSHRHPRLPPVPARSEQMPQPVPPCRRDDAA